MITYLDSVNKLHLIPHAFHSPTTSKCHLLETLLTLLNMDLKVSPLSCTTDVVTILSANSKIIPFISLHVKMLCSLLISVWK